MPDPQSATPPVYCSAPICSICHDTHTDTPAILDPLCQPCNCHNRWVHPSCLQKWLLTRPERSTMTQCEVCTAPYWGGRWGLYGRMVGVWLVEAGKVGVGEWVGTNQKCVECV